MNSRRWIASGGLAIAAGTAVLIAIAAEPVQKQEAGQVPREPVRGRAPESLPAIPRPDAASAQVPPGYQAEVVLSGLSYPTSIEFDDAGNMYVAEGGFIYGDDVAPAGIIRVSASGKSDPVADNLNGPVTDLLWHDRRLYVSHRGKISVLENGVVRDLLTGLPSLGDHHNNQMSVGPDGKIYFGQGTATNSGVVGLDNFKIGWLGKYPEVHDIPAKDIRLNAQPFETPDPIALLGDHRNGDAAGNGHEGHGSKSKGPADHSEHDKGMTPAKGKETEKKKSAEPAPHEGHDPKAKDSAPGKSKDNTPDPPKGHEHPPKDAGKEKGHEGHGAMKSPESGGGSLGMVKTFAFQPFAKTPSDDGAVRGQIKANGTILRMNPDGSDLEVYAWGLRNPFGVVWSANGRLYASDNGYDERGSRPIAHAPDCLWVVKKGAWYGFPDYAGGIPVTDSRFQPEHGPAPKFLMRDHPVVEKPFLALTHHVGAAKLESAGTDAFGFKDSLFLALSGDMNPITGSHAERSGFEVVRIDPTTGKAESFFKAKKESLGPKGLEYVVTSGPRRPVDVRLAPDGKALYVVDVGAMAILSTAIGPAPRPFPRSGVVWRITRGTVSQK